MRPQLKRDPLGTQDLRFMTGTTKPTFRIDGARFSDLEGFYDEIEKRVLRGERWGRNLDAFNDILAGEFGPLPREFRLEWVNSGLSQVRLPQSGKGSFAQLLEMIRDHSNVDLLLS